MEEPLVGKEDKDADGPHVILTLGDGDFTFSLDLARLLVAQQRQEKQHQLETTAKSLGYHSSSSPPPPPSSYHLIASGIDRMEELTDKYKDAPFVLKRLQSYNRGPQEAQLRVVSIHHGINALEVVSSSRHEDHHHGERRRGTTGSGSFVIPKADSVIFNHPHLGVEDAKLHSHFLCHLFHAVHKRWMKNETTHKSLFYLTLAKGQYEGWNCEQAATRHGMELMHRTFFAPPAVEKNPYYELRRHQTGKSFKTRRSAGQSETFTYTRRKDTSDDNADDNNSHCVIETRFLLNNSSSNTGQPFWFTAANGSRQSAEEPAEEVGAFRCSWCTKTFREERSLRNHMRSKHPEDYASRGSNKRKRVGDPPPLLSCPHCSSCMTVTGGLSQVPQPQQTRLFQSPQALQDHIRAKHTALHTEIPPDWKNTLDSRRQEDKLTSDEVHLLQQQKLSPNSPASSSSLLESSSYYNFGSCDICGYLFCTKDESLNHLSMFLPVQGRVPSSSTRTTDDDTCSSEAKKNDNVTAGRCTTTASFRCSFCPRSFHEKRAQLQHENVCVGTNSSNR